ncbi:RNA 2',3'-cyclic phosphodiesterase [Emcibacter sp.]|uniref:RNA 2',3'-cyclic phosphodiesterase n=1 Tax=Emcibacter sp. TaxID=1979954 RepID=UPI002AA95D80|nr:RNA 2',3'-cyclic phosphodiesterase [Emcibacter sp.]
MDKEAKTVRLFMAIPLTGEATETVGHFSRRLKKQLSGADIRWIPPENYHLTLAFLGNQPEEKIPLLSEILKRAGRQAAPLQITMNGMQQLGVFARTRFLAVSIEENIALTVLQDRLVRDLSENGFEVPVREFIPHITLARVRGRAALPRTLPNMELTFREQVTEIGLYRSETLQDGAVYTPVVRAVLTGRD